MVFPAEVATSCAAFPGQIEEGVALTADGADGIGLTVTTAPTRVAFSQPLLEL